MPSTIQTFSGSIASTGDEVTGKFTGTLYNAEITGVDAETDTPILTIMDDGIGETTGWTFAPGQARETEPDKTWFWKRPPL